ncbi:hypothetical protein G6F46_015680 [Rhizopus delemar]|nr:hypothetical protein G6F65_016074 [Rhizopus arrhizus]KAG1258028.1 hypothetical protein G6F66_014617 [Rhizopus arrhizus]KAG1579285.1 hypothetical protein G6F46_015680 [Rhizopus delemar]
MSASARSNRKAGRFTETTNTWPANLPWPPPAMPSLPASTTALILRIRGLGMPVGGSLRPMTVSGNL